jgi:hypothetical protein
MRTLKIIGALVLVLAFSAIAVATASAVETLWKWLPGSAKETFTGKSGKITFGATFEKTAFAFVCTKSLTLLTDSVLKVSSELLEEGSTAGKDATLALLITHMEGCTIAGLPAKSEGDSSGIILVHVEEHNCMIKPGDFGVLLKPLPLHIELPALGILILVLGDVLGLLEGKEGEKKLTFGLNLKTVKSEGKEQEFLKCEGGEKEELKASLDGVTFVPATEEAVAGSLTFDMTKDKEGEEMMEK